MQRSILKTAAAVGAGALAVGGTFAAIVSAQAANGVPAYDHIVMVMEENHSYNEVVRNSAAPYITSLANGGANFTQSFGIAHPSQPNYLALYSGSTQGVTDDTQRAYSGPNLATQLTAAGKTFVGYSQGLNSGTNWKGYHSPWLGWSTTTAAQKQDWTAFPSSANYASLPNVSIVVPDACQDMHDCSVSTGDTWLKNNLDAYAQWAKTHNSLLIVQFDEDDSSQSNQIPTIAYGANVTPGDYSARQDHYGVLGLIEDSMNLPRLNNSVGKPAITAPFTTGTNPTPTATTTSASPTPTPTNTSDGVTAAGTLGWGTPINGDEFNYTGAPDPAKWDVYNSVGNAGQGVRSPAQITVNGSAAVISGDAAGTTGGMAEKFGQQYGRWEARIQTSARDPKYHPVSILWPDNNAGTNCQEVDYGEGGADVANMHFFLHYACSGDFQTTAQAAANSSAWHNYAVDWSPAGVTGYLDGVQWFTDTNPAHNPALSSHQTLQLDWFPDGTATTPTTMTVDWVRVYAAGAVSPSPSPSTTSASPSPTTSTTSASPSPSTTSASPSPSPSTTSASPSPSPSTTSASPSPSPSTTVGTTAAVTLVPDSTGTKYQCTVTVPGDAAVTNLPCTITSH